MDNTKSDSLSGTCKFLFVPCATVFVSSFCIMVLELVAGRIIARFLGSSLYTWTSVIGVVLAGITIGNYLGGRLADRFKPVRVLAVLFATCAGACLFTIIANNHIGNWTWLWQFNWPTRILLHVTTVFLLPSALLGTISPVVAKMALERGLPTGRTVGDIYAWGCRQYRGHVRRGLLSHRNDGNHLNRLDHRSGDDINGVALRRGYANSSHSSSNFPRDSFSGSRALILTDNGRYCFSGDHLWCSYFDGFSRTNVIPLPVIISCSSRKKSRYCNSAQPVLFQLI